ncbi:MAG: hypothetical protein WC708_10590 [Lentisphaeria bacterium]
MKWPLRIGLWLAGLFAMLLVAGLAFLMFGLGPLLKHSLERMAREQLHGELTIASISINPFKASFTMNGLTVRNPPGFAKDELLAVPFVMADLDLWDSLRQRRYHFSRVIVNVKCFDFERRADGISNLDAWLAMAKEEQQRKKTAARPAPAAAKPSVATATPPAADQPPPKDAPVPAVADSAPHQSAPRAARRPPPDLMIDRLTLTLGKIYVRDATNPAMDNLELDLAIRNRELYKLKSRNQAATAVMAEVLPALLAAQSRALMQRSATSPNIMP